MQEEQQMREYRKQLEVEKETFSKQLNKLHQLPPCYSYIATKYLSKVIKEITGFSDFRDFFVSEIKSFSNSKQGQIKIASIGSGDSSEELELCKRINLGNKVVFDCYEMNEFMIAEARKKADAMGIEMNFFEQDFNQISFSNQYDGFFASHSLHHVTNLEGLFTAIDNNGKPGYFFLINDMIGRNGHMSWPRSQAFLESLWSTLPERLKWNALFERFELELPNYDWSANGTTFEGIRAQDILPLLSEHFKFEYFVPFYSLIGRIIDRFFGYNYNVDANDPNNDLALLDHLWYMDELFLSQKYLPPTQMFCKVVDPRLDEVILKSRIYKSVEEACYQHYLDVAVDKENQKIPLTISLSRQSFANPEILKPIDELMPPQELKDHVGSGDFKAIGNAILGHLINLGELMPNGRVLDVGCGCGRVALPLIQYLGIEGSYEGFDIHAPSITWCQENISHQYPNFQFQVSDIYSNRYNPEGTIQASDYKFPYPDEYFDVVFLTSIFTHLLPNDLEHYLSEIARVLKTGGRCLITVFLLNEESLSLMTIASNNLVEAGYQLTFKYNYGYYAVNDANIPEGAVAYDENFIQNLYKKFRLSILQPIHYGSWCGRQLASTGQDLIVAVKEELNIDFQSESIPLRLIQEDLPADVAILDQPKAFTDGHFYSPIPNIRDLQKNEAKIWSNSFDVLGIDFNDASHCNLLFYVFPKYIEEYDYPLEASNEITYYINNGQFGWCDSRILFCMLRHLQPKRMIEIGSGYTSLLTADVNRRFLKQELEFTCIEPYPRDFLLKGVSGINYLITQKVEDLPLSTFSNLQRGDILFIDSSHVSKTGSDVNYLFFEVIPRLSEGVLIHIHDIFLPAEYPREWIINEGRSWNEQYLVRALLMYTHGFEVLFGSAYAFYKHPELLKKVLQNHLQLGGSLWLRKKV